MDGPTLRGCSAKPMRMSPAAHAAAATMRRLAAHGRPNARACFSSCTRTHVRDGRDGAEQLGLGKPLEQSRAFERRSGTPLIASHRLSRCSGPCAALSLVTAGRRSPRGVRCVRRGSAGFRATGRQRRRSTLPWEARAMALCEHILACTSAGARDCEYASMHANHSAHADATP